MPSIRQTRILRALLFVLALSLALCDVRADVQIIALGADTDFTFPWTLHDDPAGPLRVFKYGSGTLTLTGNNTYTGGNEVGGTLAAGSPTAFGLGPMQVDGTLDLHGFNVKVTALTSNTVLDSNTGLSFATITNSGGTDATLSIISKAPVVFGGHTFAGAIKDGSTHSTALVVADPHGTTIFTGSNTYTGGTTITSGTLQIGNGGFTGNLKGDVTNNGTLAFNRLGNLIFSGLISGTGSLQQNGPGTTYLSGQNTYTGGTVINSGTLALIRGGSITGNVTNNGTLAFDRSAALVFEGNISGTGGILLGGGVPTGENSTLFTSEFVLLTGHNSYSGQTFIRTGSTLAAGSSTAFGRGSNLFIDSGTLRLGGFNVAIGSLSSAPASSFNFDTFITNGGISDATLTTSSSTDSTYDGVFLDGNRGKFNLVKTGSGTLTLTGTNFSTGSTTISEGALQIGNGARYGSFAGDIIDNAALIFNCDGSYTYGGIISGTGNIQKLGANKLTLTGDSAFTGTMTYEGTLQLGNGDTAGTIAGEIVDNTMLILDHGSHNGLTSASVSGAGSLEKLGAGTFILTGTNTYTGGTTISGGTLQLGDAGVRIFRLLPGGGISTDLILDPIPSGLTGSIVGDIVDNGALALNRNNALTLDGDISGTGEIRQTGAGTTTLSGDNSYSGGTRIANGGLNINSATALGTGTLTIGQLLVHSGGPIIITDPLPPFEPVSTIAEPYITGPVTIDNTSGAAITLTNNNSVILNADLTFKGTNDLDFGTGDVDLGIALFTPMDGAQSFALLAARTITTLAGNLTFGGVVFGDAALFKAGAGALTLSGANTYGSGTTLLAGQLNINNASAIGTGTLTIAGVSTLDNTSGAAITLTTDNAQNWNSDFNFKGTNDLNLGNGAVLMDATRTVTVNAGVLTVGAISGVKSSFGLIKNGEGTLQLTGDNAFGGTLMINEGVLQLGDGSLATTAITDKSVLAFHQTDDSVFDGKIKGGGQVWQNGTNIVTLTQTNTYTGGTVIDSGTLRQGRAKALGGSAALTVNDTGTLDLNGFDLKVSELSGTGGTITNNGGAAALLTATSTAMNTYAGVMADGASPVALIKAGSGVLILSGNNTYTGQTTIQAGTLQLDGINGSIASASLSNSGKFVINRSNAFTYAGAIKGRGSVLQNGSGTTTLTGTNRYLGGTTVNAGTLAVGSADALGKGNLTLNSGVLQTAGSQHQINVAKNLSWNSDAVIHLTLTPDADSEFVAVSGKLISLDGGPFTFDFTPVGLPMGENDFIVMTVGKGFGSLTGDDFIFTSDDPLLEGHFEVIGRNLWFKDAYGEEPLPVEASGGGPFAGGNLFNDNPSPMPVPEPATWAMLVFGGAAMILARRRVRA